MTEWQRLWSVHDYLLRELHERRARSRVYVALTSAVFAAVTAAAVSEPLSRIVGRPENVGAFLFLHLFAIASVVVSVLGINAGLPWERRGAPELLAWGLGWFLGTSMSGVLRARLDRMYEREGISYRHFRDQSVHSDNAGRRVAEIAGRITEEELGWRILGLSEQLRQARLWRRFAAITTLLDLGGFAVATQYVVVEVVKARPETVAAATVGVAIVLLAVLAFLRPHPGRPAQAIPTKGTGRRTEADPPRWCAVVNPSAGRGRARPVSTEIVKRLGELGISLDVVGETAQPGDAQAMAQRATVEGCPVILVIGGDGTTSEVANGIIGSSCVLALAPVGKGNDLARHLGYPTDLGELAPFLAGAEARWIDVGEANGRIFVNHVGVGLNSIAVEKVEPYKRVLGPRLAYVAGALIALATYRPIRLRIVVDGSQIDGTFLLVFLSNGKYTGHGIPIAPTASLADGQLELTLVGSPALTAWPRILLSLSRRRPLHDRDVRRMSVRTASIELEKPSTFDIDGTTVREQRPRVAVRVGALRVLVAEDAMI